MAIKATTGFPGQGMTLKAHTTTPRFLAVLLWHWSLPFTLGAVAASLVALYGIQSSLELVDQSLDSSMQRMIDACTDQTQPTPPDPEQVRGRAPGLSGEWLITRQTEARAQRTLDPPRIQKPPGWGVGNDLLPAPLPTGEVGL